MNALYARRAASSGWIYCADKSTKAEHWEGDYLYYPYVNVCPRCSVKGKFHEAKSKKPQPGSIGDVSSIVIAAIYDRVAQAAPGKATVLRVPGTGDADLILQEGDNICVAEIKASPLVSYPLAVTSEPIEVSDPDTSHRRVQDHHESTATHLRRETVYLYLPHVNEYIDLGSMSSGEWPLNSMSSYVSTTEGAAGIALAWSRLFRVYRDKSLRGGDNSWWLVNGCGSPRGSGIKISDGKNMPGIDRTDDLKKGTYQVLKMGATLKDRPDKSVRAALVANVHAVIHDEVYVTDLADVIWTKDGPDDDYIVRRDDKEWVIKAEGIFNLYDGIICITRSRFRDSWLKNIADVDSLRIVKS